MEQSLKQKIEEYISDWYWGEEVKEYPFELGKFLFSFMDYIRDQNLSDKTKSKHLDNVYLIGMFETEYGYQDEFEPEDLTHEPHYEDIFERKISDSESALQSYASTWRKLNRYIQSKTYEEYLKQIEKQLEKEN